MWVLPVTETSGEMFLRHEAFPVSQWLPGLQHKTPFIVITTLAFLRSVLFIYFLFLVFDFSQASIHYVHHCSFGARQDWAHGRLKR